MAKLITIKDKLGNTLLPRTRSTGVYTDSNITLEQKLGNIDATLSDKVDKITGKGLSTEDYTTAEKAKVANVPLDTNAQLTGKVDKITGKGLSTEDYTTAEKAKVSNLPLDTNAQLADKANKTQEAWITPTLLNGWTQLANDVSYMKDTLGWVHFKGAVASGAVGTQIFALPAGYRPQNPVTRFPVVANNKFGRVSVMSAGTVTFEVGESAFVSLDGITFKAV